VVESTGSKGNSNTVVSGWWWRGKCLAMSGDADEVVAQLTAIR